MSGESKIYFGSFELRFEPAKGTTTQFQIYRESRHVRGFETPEQTIEYLEFLMGIGRKPELIRASEAIETIKNEIFDALRIPKIMEYIHNRLKQ